MEARAQARNVRVSPMKARRVVDLIRGMGAEDALVTLQFAPQAASEPVGKVLASAVANAVNNHSMQAEELAVAAAPPRRGLRLATCVCHHCCDGSPNTSKGHRHARHTCQPMGARALERPK